jgi:hypothetical protein
MRDAKCGKLPGRTARERGATPASRIPVIFLPCPPPAPPRTRTRSSCGSCSRVPTPRSPRGRRPTRRATT